VSIIPSLPRVPNRSADDAKPALLKLQKNLLCAMILRARIGPVAAEVAVALSCATRTSKRTCAVGPEFGFCSPLPHSACNPMRHVVLGPFPCDGVGSGGHTTIPTCHEAFSFDRPLASCTARSSLRSFRVTCIQQLALCRAAGMTSVNESSGALEALSLPQHTRDTARTRRHILE
jgi:hypothetical protein